MGIGKFAFGEGIGPEGGSERVSGGGYGFGAVSAASRDEVKKGRTGEVISNLEAGDMPGGARDETEGFVDPQFAVYLIWPLSL
jgi:hypothetical protein